MSTTKITSEVLDLTDTYAFTGTVTGAGGGDIRNYIIDGDFTQWPEGATPLQATSQKYGPALWKFNRGGAGAVDITRSTDVPTFAQSGHTSKYSMLIEPTTADASLATSDHYGIEYYVTGSDYTALHSNIVTLSFWHKHTKTGIHSVSFQNGDAVNRSYPAEYTQSTTNTWERATITITLDTTGTWLFTEADKGLKLIFALASGTDFTGTPEQWNAVNDKASSNIVNDMDNTSNNFAISQVGLYLGSTAPTFLSSPITTVKNQVDYYIQREDYTASGANVHMGGFVQTTGIIDITISHWRTMRVAPTITFSSTASHWVGDDGPAAAAASAISAADITTYNWRWRITQAGTTWTLGNAGYIALAGADDTFIQKDARH